MLIAKTILLGLIEGITEFLPISSTAHLILAGQFLKLPQNDYWKFFEVFIQSGAILAVLTLYWQKLFNRKLLTNLFFSFVPTAIIGFALYKIIKTFFFESNWLIVLMLILFGIVFLVIETLVKNNKLQLNKKIETLSLKEAGLLGLAQSLSVVPGVSRAGIVLVSGLLMGYKRTEVALYSFWLAVPTILMAAGYDMLKTNPQVIFTNWHLTIIGFVTAYLSALVVLKWLIGYLQRHDLRAFGYYRLALGIILLLLILL